MWVSTFHSMCVRILRAEAAKLNLKSSFTIYDQGDSVRLMTMVARDLDLDAKRYPGRSLAAQVSNLKNELIDEEGYVPQTAPEKVLAEAYKLYQQRLRQAHAMDFDDLIMNTVHLLQVFPDVAEHYRRRFRHVLVDEYQDTNHAQYMLVRELVGTGERPVPQAELCVVGDADQSIYAFRGATIRNIDEFERDYPHATTILLEQNYRSTQRILKAANPVISRNTGRRPKNLWTDSGDGELIEGYVADNEHDEAAWVAEQIDALVDEGHRAAQGHRGLLPHQQCLPGVRGGLHPRRHALQGRRRGALYERKEVRRRAGLPEGGGQPDRHREPAPGHQHPQARHRRPGRGCIENFADRERIPFASALRRCSRGRRPRHPLAQGDPGVRRAARGVRAAGRDRVGPAALLESILDRTGYLTELQASTDPQDEGRVDNLNELISVAAEFEAASPGGTVTDFLEQVSLVADADQIPVTGDDAGVVTMMTLHTAKGLEFPVVFLTALEDGVFPHLRALGDPRELEEERRLAYVGITRAQQRLFLSRAQVRTSWGPAGVQPAVPVPRRAARRTPCTGPGWSPRRRPPATRRRSRGSRPPGSRPAGCAVAWATGRSSPSTSATGSATTRSVWAPWSR